MSKSTKDSADAEHNELFCTRYKDASWRSAYVTISVAMLDLAFEVLKPSEFKVLMFLARNERQKSRVSEVSVRYVAQGLQGSTRTAFQALARLEELKLVERAPKGYRIRHFPSREDWEAVVQRNTTKSVVQRNTSKTTGVFQNDLGVCSNGPQSKEVLSDEEGAGGKKPEPPPAPLRLVEIPSTEPKSDQNDVPERFRVWLDRARSGFDLAYAVAVTMKNPVLQKSYYRKALPTSFQSCYCPPGFEELFSRYHLLGATNSILAIQRELGIEVPSLPNTYAEVSHLGDVLSSFLDSDHWDREFTAFYRWVLQNKKNWSYNLLGYYVCDWQESTKQWRKVN